MESILPKTFQTDDQGNVSIKMSQSQFFIISETLRERERVMLEKENADRIELDKVFNMFIRNYEILSKNSKKNYRQQYKNLLTWCHIGGRNLNLVGEITKDVAEQYIRHAYSTKKTAKFEIRTYRRIWNAVFPESYANPWIHKLHLATFHPKKNMSHRPFTRKEIRQILTFLDSVIEFKKREMSRNRNVEPSVTNENGHRKRLPFFTTYSLAFIQDLRDAVVFAATYGMRMGSVASLKWSDFKQFSHKPFFYHVPPKTARAKPTPLELPYMEQTTEILERRRPENINAAYRHGEPLFKEFSSVYDKGSQVMSCIFGRLVDKLKIKDTGIGVASFHSFRTTFVTFMDEAIAPKMITDSITGHSSKEMHYIYSKPSARVKRKWIHEAYNKFDFSTKFDEELIKEFENEEKEAKIENEKEANEVIEVKQT